MQNTAAAYAILPFAGRVIFPSFQLFEKNAKDCSSRQMQASSSLVACCKSLKI
jgi:hypothetical protein